MATDTILNEGRPTALHDTNEQVITTDRPPSRNLMISPNLVAALEFDERIRRTSSPDLSSHTACPMVSVGLPPPPRAKNGGTKARKPASAGLPEIRPLQHIPPNLPSSPSAWNPYINPTPLIPYLMYEEPPVPSRPHPASAPNSPIGAEQHAFIPQRTSSTGGYGTQPETSIIRRAHRRYLSSLPKVERFLGRGNGRKAETSPVKEDERHGSNGDISPSSKLDMQEKQLKRIMVLTEDMSSPVTVMTSSPSDYRAAANGLASPTRAALATATQPQEVPTTRSPPEQPAGPGVATTTRSRKVTGTGGTVAIPVGGPAPASGSRVAGGTRAGNSHGGLALDGAVLSRSEGGKLGSKSNILDLKYTTDISDSAFFIARSVPLASSSLDTAMPMSRASSSSVSSAADSLSSSHQPASTPTEARISISSTIYPASSYDHSYNSRFSYPQSGRPSMSAVNSDRESFIEFASPVSSPRSPDFTSPHERVNSIYSTSSFNVNPNLYKQKSKELPALTIPVPGAKPPIPTAPKPDFSRRSHSVQPPGHRSSSTDTARDHSPPNVKPSRHLPPTTSFLNSRERADRVRQNKKLTKVFGQTPGNLEALAFSHNAYEVNLPPPNYLSLSDGHASTLNAKRRHQRGAVSMSVTDEPPSAGSELSRAVWPPPEGTVYLSLSGARRHSSPLTTQEFVLPEIDTGSWSSASASSSFGRDTSDLIDVGSEEGMPHSDWSSHAGYASVCRAGVLGPGSPTSFMDLSDEEVPGDANSIITVETPKATRRTCAPFSPSTPSLLESISPQERAEEDRRRKRDKLARLHRFLGSRVPVDLVLAQVEVQPPSPPAVYSTAQMSNTEARKIRMRRRRSSSAAEFAGTWSDDIDRLKEDLNEREKAINVRRAVKMEKMFGVAPPQILYHTRHKGSPSSVGQTGNSLALPPKNRTPPQSPITSALRNLNQSSYTRGRTKKALRPGTADSSEPLIKPADFEDAPTGHALSDIYLHYRHSLNSLNDIIDRDDKESLVDLHDYLHGSVGEPQLQSFTLQDTHSTIPSSASKAERRRSLPARASMTSLNSEFSISSITSPQPEDSTFQTRRRRAAKLTQFFGVDYRDLMCEILDSIEKGVEEEGGRGALKPDEVQDLLQKLKKLKLKRNNLS